MLFIKTWRVFFPLEFDKSNHCDFHLLPTELCLSAKENKLYCYHNLLSYKVPVYATNSYHILQYSMERFQHQLCSHTIVINLWLYEMCLPYIIHCSRLHRRTESGRKALINRGCEHLSLIVTKRFTMDRTGRELWRGCTHSSTSTTHTGFHYRSTVKYFLSQHLECNWTRCQAAPLQVDRGHIVCLAIIRNERGLRTTVGGNSLCNCLKWASCACYFGII